MNELPLAEGDLIAGRYRVVRKLADGGIGMVFEASDERTSEKVALKIVRPELALDSDVLARLSREAAVLERLDHPNVVKLHGFGILPSGAVFLVLELLDGETLRSLLDREGTLSPAALEPIVRDVCAGLDAAHAQSVIHRDLKPANVFLARARPGTPARAKLLDFGLSRILGDDALWREGEVVGTPRYMAPEQLRGANDVDRRADVYAVGVLAHRALFGSYPFPTVAPDLRALGSAPGSASVSAIRAALAPEPGDRPDSAGAFARLFSAGLA